jgi:chromate reductase, NAD(P)H dehydrogenase (quinone)
MKRKVLAISGSIRKDSSNLRIIKAIAALAHNQFDIEIYNDLALLPHFNPDIDKAGATLKTIEEFRNKIKEAHGILICTPEYVFSLPGSLKNAIEWTVSTTLFSIKPVALITAAASGEKAHESLLLIMKTLEAKLSPTSQILISGGKSKINSKGEITDDTTLNKIKDLIADFTKMLNEAK